MVFHEDPASVGPQEPAWILTSVLLPAPLSPSEPEHLAPVQVHVDAAEGHDRTKALADVLRPAKSRRGRDYRPGRYWVKSSRRSSP